MKHEKIKNTVAERRWASRTGTPSWFSPSPRSQLQYWLTPLLWREIQAKSSNNSCTLLRPQEAPLTKEEWTAQRACRGPPGLWRCLWTSQAPPKYRVPPQINTALNIWYWVWALLAALDKTLPSLLIVLSLSLHYLKCQGDSTHPASLYGIADSEATKPRFQLESWGIWVTTARCLETVLYHSSDSSCSREH